MAKQQRNFAKKFFEESGQELYNYMHDDHEVYEQIYLETRNRLLRYIRDDRYTKVKAVRLWNKCVERAARRYHEEQGPIFSMWNVAFPYEVRMDVSKEIRDAFAAEHLGVK